jgi:hypothetical protein
MSDAGRRIWVDLDDDREDEVAFFCRKCAAREFGTRQAG